MSLQLVRQVTSGLGVGVTTHGERQRKRDRNGDLHHFSKEHTWPFGDMVAVFTAQPQNALITLMASRSFIAL